MTFAEDIAIQLAEGRELVEELMTDTCVITRPDPDAAPPEMDDKGEYPDGPRVTIYEGKCRLQIKSVIASGSATAGGERSGTVQEIEWQGPVAGTENIAVGDTIEVVTAVFDDAPVGRVFTVAALHHKSQATARRLRVREGTS